MQGVPRGFFPQLMCILQTCNHWGVNKFKQKIEQLNASRMTDNRKRSIAKVWVTKTKVTEGVKQSYLHWNHERCNYEGLVNLYCEHLKKWQNIPSWQHENIANIKRENKILLKVKS